MESEPVVVPVSVVLCHIGIGGAVGTRLATCQPVTSSEHTAGWSAGMPLLPGRRLRRLQDHLRAAGAAAAPATVEIDRGQGNDAVLEAHGARLAVGRRRELDAAIAEALGAWPGGCGVRPPRRSADRAEAARIAAREGVSIVTGLAETDREAADRLPSELWGGELTGWLGPAEIRNTGEREVLTLGKANGQAQLTNRHQRGAHTDSYKGHGSDCEWSRAACSLAPAP